MIQIDKALTAKGGLPIASGIVLEYSTSVSRVRSPIERTYDAVENTPSLDSEPMVTVGQGWKYEVTEGGDFFTQTVEVGNILEAKQNNPTELSHWTIYDSADDAPKMINYVNWGSKPFTNLTDYENEEPALNVSFIEIAKKYTKVITDQQLSDLEAQGDLADTWYMELLDNDLGGAYTSKVTPYS